MEDYPMIQDLNTGRSLYGPSLSGPSKIPQWSPQDFEDESSATKNVSLALGTLGVTAASGFISTEKGNLWDHYTSAIRAAEQYSPAGFLRTFQISNFTSQFSSSVRDSGLKITGEQLEENIPYQRYLSELIGPSGETGRRLISEGVELRGGQLFFGETDDVALKYASALTTPVGSRQYLGAAHVLNVGNTGMADPAIALSEVTNKYGGKDIYSPVISGKEDLVTTIVGGQSRREYARRAISAQSTEYVSRFNRLLKAPFEMEPFQTVFGAIKKRAPWLKFAVEEGSGTQMLGRLTKKYGLKAGALLGAYSTVDWAVRNTDFLDDTYWDDGITTGIAEMGATAHVAVSRLAEVTGGHAYKEMQEEIAPGSTSLATLAAFPLIGGSLAAFAGYGATVYKMAGHQIQSKATSAEARVLATEGLEGVFTGETLLSKIGKAVSLPSGLFSRQDAIGNFVRAIGTKKGDEISYKFLGKIGPTKLVGLLGAAAGAALALPFVPGALAPTTRPDELERIYSGEQEVAIRSGRGWEFGRSSYGGDKISYFRPHWLPMMRQRSKDVSLWGEDEPTPFTKFFKKEFTYDLEKKHYSSRPYPVTGTAFEDVPLLGPLLGATIGKLLKPPKLMHEEEWLRGGGLGEGETIQRPAAFGARIATELGETAGEQPISPHSFQGVAGEQAYRMTEMMGLPGFVATSVKEALTGTPDLFDKTPQLESSRRMAGAERAYWDKEIGGGVGTTEGLRRLLPHRRRQIPLYNPIRNEMPEWLTGPGERGIDLLHGDPFVKLPEGEVRLPGAGYAQRFEELKGVNPADYPLIHRYKIMADVAPHTRKFQALRRQVQAAELSTGDQKLFEQTEDQLKQKRVRKEFDEYKILPATGNLFSSRDKYTTGANSSSELLTALNEMTASQERNTGVINKLFGGYWELLAHNAETAFDSLTPLAPASKLIHKRSAVEDYESRQVFGTENAFWQHPIRDFIRPFSNIAGNTVGLDSIPGHVQEKRELEAKFDVLKYVKASRLANMARLEGDDKALSRFERDKNKTLFGLNPFAKNLSSIYSALPRRDRNYFESFAGTSDAESREQIAKLVPQNEKSLFLSRWKMGLREDIERARESGVLGEKEEAQAQSIERQIKKEEKTEGLPSSKELFAEYIKGRLPGESYPDWYRREKLLKGVALPGADWVGWHSSVDLDDVKLKVVQNLGEDAHEYDLWPDQARTLLNKKYINTQAVEALTQPMNLSDAEMRSRTDALFLASEMKSDTFVRRTYGFGMDSRMRIDVEQEPDIDQLVRELTR